MRVYRTLIVLPIAESYGFVNLSRSPTLPFVVALHTTVRGSVHNEYSDLGERCDLSWQLPGLLSGVTGTTPSLREPDHLHF